VRLGRAFSTKNTSFLRVFEVRAEKPGFSWSVVSDCKGNTKTPSLFPLVRSKELDFHGHCLHARTRKSNSSEVTRSRKTHCERTAAQKFAKAPRVPKVRAGKAWDFCKLYPTIVALLFVRSKTLSYMSATLCVRTRKLRARKTYFLGTSPAQSTYTARGR